MPTLSKADQRELVSQNAARTRKENALARLRELEVAERERRVIPADEVADAWTHVVAAVKSSVLRIPDNCAIAVAAVTEPREARLILAREVESILKNLSDDIQRLSESGYFGSSGSVKATRTRKPRGLGKRALPAKQ